MTSKFERSNQLTQVADYDVNNMMFSEPQSGAVPNTPISYTRVNISTLNKDKTIGDLILPTEVLFSFGVSENKNQETNNVNGHVLPLCLWSRNGPTKEEKAWTDTFDKIVEHCKKHLIDNREELNKHDLEMADLKKFNPLYWKREKGKIVEGTGPTLYAKLITSKKQNVTKILSMFFNEHGDNIDPLSLLGKYCYVKAAIKIESIFVGNKMSLQIKVYEAECKLMDTGMKPLMRRPRNSGRMLTADDSRKTNSFENIDTENFDNEDAGSLNNSDDEKEQEKPQNQQAISQLKPLNPTPPVSVAQTTDAPKRKVFKKLSAK